MSRFLLYGKFYVYVSIYVISTNIHETYQHGSLDDIPVSLTGTHEIASTISLGGSAIPEHDAANLSISSVNGDQVLHFCDIQEITWMIDGSSWTSKQTDVDSSIGGLAARFLEVCVPCCVVEVVDRVLVDAGSGSAVAAIIELDEDHIESSLLNHGVHVCLDTIIKWLRLLVW